MSKAQWDSAMVELQKDMARLREELEERDRVVATLEGEVESLKATRYVECPGCGAEVEAKAP